ncbi:MAG: hypothetical protein KA138_10605 [Saprospiraceae bacterium]|nr:hypothetical protein [Lewinellaceae bacterium]MBP6811961.1 hypothetical protein [Saprospiraceae bacterium]
MKKIILFSLALVFSFAACTHCPEIPDDKTPQQTSDFAFWVECGECIPITDKFSIHDGMLFDENGQTLHDSLLQFAKTLQTNMPDLLCTSSLSDYGCGSCYDLYSVFVRTECNGLERTWQFDPNDSSIPAVVRAYSVQVEEIFWKCAK